MSRANQNGHQVIGAVVAVKLHCPGLQKRYRIMAEALEGYFNKETVSPQFLLAASVPVPSSVTLEHFLSSLDVWIRRPQVVNKRLLGAIIKEDCFVSDNMDSEETATKLQTREFSRELIPKQCGVPRGWETILIAESNEMVTFHSHKTIGSEWTVSYQFRMVDAEGSCGENNTKNCIELRVARNPRAEAGHKETVRSGSELASMSSPNRSTVPSEEWLRDVLLVKIVKWAQEASLESSSSCKPLKTGLVSLDRFAAVYSTMKEKYGKKLVESWSESTDPKKFVYEDISIATYLIILWENDRERLGLEKKQSFIDLGCGNGLLVHLLNCEGYPGKGIDLKKRKIWKMFQPQTVLEERSIVPSNSNLFPESDWLIGNHSDELTPWIPLMAARSSYTANFFVLPCCPHDFIGKFSRPSTSKSQYRCYLDYVVRVGEVVGFKVEEDTLRIPSSKRICFVGRQRTYSCCDEDIIEVERKAFLVERCKGRTPSFSGSDSHMEDTSLDTWCSHFEPRPQEAIRKNCVQIDPQLSEHIVNTVAGSILKCPLRTDNTVKTFGEDSALQWRKGESMMLDRAASLFDSSVLQHLKLEYGGLQTLLKNHHQVFEIVSGKVLIRDWTLNDCNPPPSKKMRNRKKKSMPKKSSGMFVKTKMCWFALHHPDGCPRPAQACSYAHSREELNQRPSFEPKFLSNQV